MAVFLSLSAFSLPILSYSQASKSLVLASSQVSVERLASSEGIPAFPSYGISLMIVPSNALAVGVSATFADPTSEYDLVGSTVSQRLHLSSYRIVASVLLVSVSRIVDFSATGGLGFMTLRSEPRSISAGGFGTIVVSGQSEQFTTYSLGVRASTHLTSHISVFLSPELLLVSPVRVFSSGYLIGGGLAIGIL